MHGERLYETTRGLTAGVAAGVAGLLLWVATHVGTQTAGRFWAAMAIVAGAGAVASVAQAVSGWTKGLRLRISTGTVIFAFLPTLVCVAWILIATQPADGFAQGHVVSWSRSLGLLGVIYDLALWHGALAFATGLVFGQTWDAVPAPPVRVEEGEPVDADEALTAELAPAAEPGASLPGGIMSAPRATR